MEQGCPNGPSPVAVASPKVILVVDDEEVVRQFVGTVLIRHGFRIVSAAGPAEALHCLEKAPRIDLLLTDVRMPAMTGVHLAREIVRRRPATRILFMSGSCDEEYRSVTSEPLLAKPFGIAQLLDCVENALLPSGRSDAIGA
jgi:two-component system, cell cycle sensor histidine kinase and response regulator CckA